MVSAYIWWGGVFVFLLCRVGLQLKATTWKFVSLPGSLKEQAGSEVPGEASHGKLSPVTSTVDHPPGSTHTRTNKDSDAEWFFSDWRVSSEQGEWGTPCGVHTAYGSHFTHCCTKGVTIGHRAFLHPNSHRAAVKIWDPPELESWAEWCFRLPIGSIES